MKKFSLVPLFLLIFSFQTLLYSQVRITQGELSNNVEIGDFKCYFDSEKFYFDIYNINIKNMKNSKIYFMIELRQNNMVVTTYSLDPQDVKYDDSLWSGKSCWFFFSRESLSKKSNTNKSYRAYFRIILVKNDGTERILAQKVSPFN